MQLRPGEQVGPYVVVALLGAGGMGEVYRARDPRLEREVALKVLQSAKEGEASQGHRMLREARAAAALEHPNVVTVYDVGEVRGDGPLAGATYLAMELVKGKALRGYVGDASVPPDLRVGWIRDVAKALAAAHERGLVHRDVKPENVMIRDDGTVKVLDFGLARRHAGPALPSATTEGSQVLGASFAPESRAAGTPLYMAPEQLRGEPSTGATDQFAWGVMAYELLTGASPWAGAASGVQLVAAILSVEPPALDAAALGIPEGVAAVVMRALAKRPEERFPSFRELLRELGGTEHVSFRTAPPQGDGLPFAPTRPAVPTPMSADAPTGGTDGGKARAPAPSRARTRWALSIAAAAVALGGALAFAVLGGRLRREAPAPAAAASSAAGCTTSSSCAAQGRASVCSPRLHTCVPLAAAGCRVFHEPEDIGSDETLWLGALLPMSGAPNESFGLAHAQALDLARRDFAQAARQLRAGRRTSWPLRIGVVACDDRTDAHEAASHLVEHLGVPAVIGFRTSGEAVALASSLFVPTGTLALAALNMSPVVTEVAHPPGSPRLVWRTTYNARHAADALTRLLRDHLEPLLRKRVGSEPLRVFVLRYRNAAGDTFADMFSRELVWNGKSAMENDRDYRERSVDEDRPEAFEAVAREITAFRPHVVFYAVAGTVVPDLFARVERDWPAHAKTRPIYATMNSFPRDLFEFIGRNAELRHRFYGVSTVSTTPANWRFVTHYNETFGASMSLAESPNTSYDAFYVAAYAAHAVHGGAPTGRALAEAIPRLLGPGKRVEVGPAGIYGALQLLERGERIELVGTTGELHLDPATGDASFDQSITCIGADAEGRADRALETGLVYAPMSHALVGAFRCP